jgi:hypothetical protein
LSSRDPRHPICLSTALAVSCGLLGPSAEAAVTVRVRGTSHLEARAIPRPEEVEIRGNLKDDTGSPISKAQVRLGLTTVAGGAALPTPRACPQLPPVQRTESALVANTDGLGRFCVRIDSLAVGSGVTLRFDGNEYFDASETVRVAVDASKRSLQLRFSPRPRYLSLDRPTHLVQVDTRVASEPRSGDALQLTLLFTERGREPHELETVTTRLGKRARFELASTTLGGPGPGTLTVRFAGSETIQSTQHSVVVERTARVSLSLAGSINRGDPTRGVPISVAVGSAVGAVPSGTVEALYEGDSVGTGRVAAGSALVKARFDPPARDRVPITLRYLPDAPWWQAGAPLAVTLPLAPASPWRLWPWALGVLAVLAWVLRSWRRPARPPQRRREAPAGPPSGRASIEVIERGLAREGWRGQVTDAHDGAAIAGAKLSLVVPSFAPDAGEPDILADADGRFVLHPLPGGTEGVRLRVAARWHTELSRPLPPAGKIHVHLVSRRRTLVNRLVDWAERMGYPWRRDGDATPGEVKDAAESQGMDQVADWAGAVEHAAFGADPVDGAREHEVRRREPHWKSREDTSR